VSRTKKKLLSKLYLYGIRGNLLLWLEHYICDRSHKTRVGDSSSSPVDAQFHIHDTGLPQLSQGRDLGVVITSDLSCSLHIQQICVKAHQRANSILHCFVSGNVKLILRAFIVYVRPMLEYNSVTWSSL